MSPETDSEAMSQKTVLSLIESPTHPKLSGLYKQMGLREIQVNSSRKAISERVQSRCAVIQSSQIFARH